MNISTLAKVLGTTVQDLRDSGAKNGMRSFSGRNTRIPYADALAITKILRPDKAEKLKNDDNIYVPSTVSVAELAEVISKPPGLVVKTLIMNGILATLNEKIDFDTAALISEEMGITIHPEKSQAKDTAAPVTYETSENIFTRAVDGGKFITRPPVVTIMGHVDHGKTTLLDTIRKSNVAAGEAGAITQHISSYQVTFDAKTITFVDTPGHQAFTAMRARGTQLADIIILVVSATEGPKPQTVEVIERAKLSRTPVIVAINKIDLPEADIEKTKADIAAFGLVPEEWGGDTAYIAISGKLGTNVDQILHTILLMAEVADLKGQIDCQSQAVVIESHLDKTQGSVATILITKNAISVSDHFAYGEHTGKVRKITDGLGKNQTQASLCMPVEISGLSQVANTGETLFFFDTAKDAQNIASVEKIKRANRKIFFSKPKDGNETDIKIMLKTDVLGSLEALKESVVKIPQESVKVLILSESVGEVSDSDIDFAQTTGATILAFHTAVPAKVGERARQNQIGLIQSDIIYELLEWIEEQILARTTHEIRVEVIGTAKVLAVFKSEKPKIVVFGGEVLSGKINDAKMLRIMSGDEEKARFEIVELQKSKVKVKEVNISQQFGVSCTGRGKVEVGDIIECIDEIVIK